MPDTASFLISSFKHTTPTKDEFLKFFKSKLLFVIRTKTLIPLLVNDSIFSFTLSLFLNSFLSPNSST